jgi:MarR family transcriptional repressor of emrRAB
MTVSGFSDQHLTNIVGSLSVGLSDRIKESTEGAAGHAAAAPSALVALHEFLGRGSMDQLRQAVGLSHSGAVRLIDRLTHDGYVQRQPAADRRSLALVLTATGRAAAKRVLSARAASVASVLDCLSDNERRSLAGITEKLVARLTEERLDDRERGKPPSGGWICRLCDFDACGRPDGACPAAAAAEAHR